MTTQKARIVHFDSAYRRVRNTPTQGELLSALRTIERACRAEHEGTPSADRIAQRLTVCSALRGRSTPEK